MLLLIFHLTHPFSPLLSFLHLLHCLLCSVLPLCGCPSVLQALAQAIKEAKEQHPDMSVTRVVVHKETELAEEEDWLNSGNNNNSNSLLLLLFMVKVISEVFINSGGAHNGLFYKKAVRLNKAPTLEATETSLEMWK